MTLAPTTDAPADPRDAALEVLSALVLESGKRWSEVATDWQRRDAEAVLDPSPDCRKLFYLTRPRGSSKTSDAAGTGLAALVTQFPPHSRGYVVAVDGDQAGLFVDAAAGMVDRTGMQGMVKVERGRLVNATNDARIEIVSADAASAFGLRPFWVWVDEFAQWPNSAKARRLWEAMLSSVPKVAGCRLVCMTSAGDPGHWSHRVLEAAKASARWAVHEQPGPVPWIDPASLAEQAALLPASAFQRLHMNVWTSPEDRLTTTDDVSACVRHQGPLEPDDHLSYVIGVDLGVKADHTAIAVCHAERDAEQTVVVVDRLETFTPTRDHPVDLGVVELAIEEAARQYHARVVGDPWQGLSMYQRLRSRGIRVREWTFSASSVGRLALNLYTLLRDHRLAIPDDPELIDELGNVRLRESSPGVYRLDHDADGHDDRAIAIGLACVALLDRPPQTQLDLGTLAAANEMFGRIKELIP